MLRLLRRQIVERVIAESQNGSIDDAVDAYLSARSDPYDRLSRMIGAVLDWTVLESFLPQTQDPQFRRSALASSFLAMLLYSLVMFVLMILAAIPIGLGLLVWFPLLVTSSYAAYRQIFTGEVVFSGAA